MNYGVMSLPLLAEAAKKPAVDRAMKAELDKPDSGGEPVPI